MDARRKQTVQRALMYLFFGLAVLLTQPEAEGARMLFVAVAWSLFVYVETAYFIPQRRTLRNLVRVGVVVLLAPLALVVVFSVGDAVGAYFSSDAADNSAGVAQQCFGEFRTLFSTLGRIRQTGDLRQFNGHFKWFFFVLSLAGLVAFVKFALFGLVEGLSRLKRRGDLRSAG